MEVSVLKKPKLVVALDIGSTYSGYAWQWREDYEKNPSNIQFNKQWGGGGMEWHKTTTCLLLNKNKDVDSFGFVAEQRYTNYLDESVEVNHTDLYSKWYFFKFFKMLLYRETKGLQDKMVEDYLGQQLSLMEVMTKFIGALRQHFLDKLLKSHTVAKKDILWVLTVPAIWTDDAKAFMRTAAERSGVKPRNLLLALEPEAAAIHCIFLPLEERTAMGNLGNVGDKFIVADLGGGTADVSAQEVKEGGFLEQILSGQGSRAGGQDINNAFFQDFRELFSVKGQNLDKFWLRNRTELLRLEQDFEKSKVAIGQEAVEVDEKININLPDELKDKIKDGTFKVNPSESFIEQKSKIMYRSSYIRKTLFEQVVGIVAEPITDLLRSREGKQITKIVLVGGFAESVIVKEKLEEKMKDFDVKFMVPTSPLYAVIKGAVFYGHNPFIFSSRMCELTYGISINRLFQDGEHEESKKWKAEDKQWYCKDIFSIHVKRGMRVSLGQKQTIHTYNPMRKLQTTLSFPIYSSTSTSPKYVTDSECDHLATLTVDIPDTTGGTERKVEVTMIYGGTELAVLATDKNTEKEYSTKIQYH